MDMQTQTKPNSARITPTTSGKDLLAEVTRLQAENELLKAKAYTPGKLTFKVSVKGACSVYGLGRWPFTGYREQWLKLFAAQKDIVAFLDEHKTELSTGKTDPRFAKVE